MLYEPKDKKNRQQVIAGEGIITHVTSPDNKTHVKILSAQDFIQAEYNKLEVDYCTIIGDKLHISKKADYNYVHIHYAPESKINFAPTTEKCFDQEKMNHYIHDERPMVKLPEEYKSDSDKKVAEKLNSGLVTEFKPTFKTYDYSAMPKGMMYAAQQKWKKQARIEQDKQ